MVENKCDDGTDPYVPTILNAKMRQNMDRADFRFRSWTRCASLPGATFTFTVGMCARFPFFWYFE